METLLRTHNIRKASHEQLKTNLFKSKTRIVQRQNKSQASLQYGNGSFPQYSQCYKLVSNPIPKVLLFKLVVNLLFLEVNASESGSLSSK